ncbi:tol-pal system protein YbgF [Pseudodonghicola xiamenensis]|uniref:Cell division coordinator CpoB n=1 Tax=Pseudodonghicola xiamenensis TaxID=337702 RepID=A0A8J3MCF7_9RHOB|nr:tol-pal system protein YbgF [Pseudodonghicola xiamenensis]GHG84191.1 tol-pal system protein YbgF [Pseudodonghicola xiamenensis]
MRVLVLLALSALIVGRALPVSAAGDETLADIRQELNVLYVEVQRLKRELSTTGAPQTQISGNTVLERVADIESELQRLTAKTEQLDHRVNQVVEDGTNRIGDLEFRLVELEGGDVSQLKETTTLGGEMPAEAAAPAAVKSAPSGEVDESQLAVGEKADFDAATAAYDSKEYARAAELYAAFNQTYPGSPLSPRASLNRGHALDALGDTREAARAYLAAFTAEDTGPAAPEALFELGAALGRLGQGAQACVTLGQVSARFPASSFVSRAQTEMTALNCQ